MNGINPPTAADLVADPVIQAALALAWVDSLPSGPRSLRHEEGGWIYLDLKTGQLKTARALRGKKDEIDLSQPPIIADSVVVGKFHTHPNPASEGWITGPSAGDLKVDSHHGVPDLIMAEDGVHFLVLILDAEDWEADPDFRLESSKQVLR